VAHHIGQTGRYKPQAGSQMATPNVIPMADIMLVLLIIFMVVTPMLQKNMPVDMARTDTARDMRTRTKMTRSWWPSHAMALSTSGIRRPVKTT